MKRDRPGLVSIIKRCDNLTKDEKDCALELLDIYLKRPSQKDYSFLTAVDDNGLALGYICYGKRPLTEAAYDVYWIAVDPGARRLGAGAMLLNAVVSALKKKGSALLIAETSGDGAYEGARKFYVANGFSEEARITDFYKPGDDLVVFVKRF